MSDPEIIEGLPEEDITMIDAPEISLQFEEEIDLQDQQIDDENDLQSDEEDQVNNRDGEQISSKRLKLSNVPTKRPSSKRSRQKTSKWILYLSENRKRVIDEHPELTFPQVTKLLAEQYKSLSSEEIESLEKKVAEINANLASAVDEEGEEEEINDTVRSPAELHIPLARVKKCMKFDPDVKNISKESLALMTKATELFIEKLAVKSQATGALRVGKTIKLNDLIHTIHYDPIFEFLTMDFPKSLLQTTAPKPKTSKIDSNKRISEEEIEKELKENAFEGNVVSENGESQGRTKDVIRRAGGAKTQKTLIAPVSGKNSITSYFAGRKRSSRDEGDVDDNDEVQGGEGEEDEHDRRREGEEEEDEVIEEEA